MPIKEANFKRNLLTLRHIFRKAYDIQTREFKQNDIDDVAAHLEEAMAFLELCDWNIDELMLRFVDPNINTMGGYEVDQEDRIDINQQKIDELKDELYSSVTMYYEQQPK